MFFQVAEGAMMEGPLWAEPGRSSPPGRMFTPRRMGLMKKVLKSTVVSRKFLSSEVKDRFIQVVGW